MADTGVPILMYHDVSPEPEPAFRRYAVTSETFARQMRWLASSGYEAIDLDDLLAARRDPRGLPDRPVVITFDDGLQSCAEHAVPVLRDHGFTAVFFLVADLVGTTTRWMRDTPGVELRLFDWETAETLVAAGFQVGSHTATHPRLTALEAARCRDELLGARLRLERELGRSVAHLAYPYGAWNDAVREIAAEAGYTTACSTRPALSAPGDDPLALPRVSVYGHDGPIAFRTRVRTGLDPGARLGRALEQVAGRLRPGGRKP